jgi:hypothetical protein
LAQLAQGIEFITNGSLDDFHLTYAYGYGYNSAATAWQELWTGLNRGGRQFWWWGTAGILCGALLILLGAIKLAARRVEISWRDAPASTAVLALRRKLLAPCFQTNWLRHRLSRALNANPIGWLQQYSPSARLVKWGWCAFVVLVETFLSANDRDIYLAQEGIGLLLLLGLTFSATGSFRNELESGAFELLLVTPLREWQIIAGRVQGLWRQFLPAAGLYAAGYIYLTSGWEGEDYFVQAELGLLRFAVGFLTLPFIGLYFSLKRWNFFVAWITASLCGLAPGAIGHVLAPNGGLTFAVQAGIAFAAGMLLLKRLENREFLEAAAA